MTFTCVAVFFVRKGNVAKLRSCFQEQGLFSLGIFGCHGLVLTEIDIQPFGVRDG